MPVKRRLDKGRKRQLESDDLEDHFYGPGTCLFNGSGYLGPYNNPFWRDVPDNLRSVVRAEMLADWERHWPTIMAAWESRTAHDLYIARAFHGAPSAPWSLIQFGRPVHG